ncbi:MAG TPA: hypothetical protein VGE35_00440 [Candidatus Paceibacterota bacterium]
MQKRAYLNFKNSLLIVAVAVMAIVVGFESYFLLKNDKPQDPLRALWSGNFTKEREAWKKQIDRVGTEKAYEEFRAETLAKPFGIGHTLAHIFGELIYDKEGVPGIAYCDSSFSYGCYHSFFGKAISEHGVGILPDLDKKCIGRWGEGGLGCQHGIGHGLMGYLGDDKINEALELCGTLTWKGELGGCSSGVFMEYNFHTMQSLTGIENRPFDAKDPLYPCESVPKKYTRSCYFELADWLGQVFAKDYTKVGDICRTVADKNSRDICFKGLGNSLAVAVSFDVAKGVNACSRLDGEQENLLCRIGVGWAFYSEPNLREKYRMLCGGLSTTDQATCLKEATLLK